MIINQNFHEMITRKYGVLKHRQLRSPALIFLSLNRAVLPFHRLLKEITIIHQNKNISHYHHYHHYHYANYPVTLNLFSLIFPDLTKEHSRQAEPLGKNFFHFPNLYKFTSTHITAAQSLSFAGKLPLVNINREVDENFYLIDVLPPAAPADVSRAKLLKKFDQNFLLPFGQLAYRHLRCDATPEVNKNFSRSPGLLLEPPLVLKEQIIKSFVGSRGGFSKEPLAAGGNFASSSYGMKNMPVENAGATVSDLKHFNPSAVVPAHITETVHGVTKNIIESETITQESISSFSTSQQGKAEAEANGKKAVNVGQLTEQVYRMLMHKIKIEKERRGL